MENYKGYTITPMTRGCTVFEQGEATDTWSIQHNLHKYPSVILVDSAGTAFFAEVTYDSLDHLTVKINGATKGKAYLN